MASHTYEETVTALQTNFVRVASFAVALGGQPGNQDVSMGLLSDYNGAPSIPEATSGKAFDLETVGQEISLVEAINEFVIDEICSEYVPVI